MPALIALSAALVAWSMVANLMIGEVAYTSRNLLLAALLVAGWTRVAKRGHGSGLADLGLARRDVPAGLRWGLSAFAIIGAAIGLGVLLADTIEPIALLLEDQRAAEFADDLAFVALVRIPLGTAVFEEIAFRGVLLAAGLRVLSPLRAVAWSSVIFGLWHIAPTMVALRINDIAVSSGEGIGTIIGAVAITTVAGFGFCWLRLASGSLVAPILAHCATNSIGLVAAVAVQDGWLGG